MCFRTTKVEHPKLNRCVNCGVVCINPDPDLWIGVRDYSTPARLFQYCEAGEQWRPAATPPDRSSSLAPTIVRRRVRSFLCVQRSRLPDRGRSCPS